MPQELGVDVKIGVIAGKPVELPSGEFVANADMARHGVDLHLTAPDGQTIIVEGYFAQDPAPDLVTHDGARLSPQLVDSFLPPEHAGQYAAAGQTVNDAGPAGRISEVIGEARIVRADGTKVEAAAGTPVYQGDRIETSKTGAVNIQFADNTTFAVSENARLVIDNFVYDPAHQSGSSFFSMLQGVFVYTSGLIGKTDPGSVNIETPVGSIGIRGTVVAGDINPAGEDSKITILDGAVTFTNGTGTQELSKGFDTLSLNGYQDTPDLGQMDVNTFHSTYGALSGVANDTMGHFNGATPQSGDASPAGQGEGSPDGAEDAASPANAGVPSPTDAPTPQPGDAPPPGAMMPPPGTMMPDGAMMPPPGTMMPDGAMMPPPGTMMPDGAGMPPPGTMMPGMYGAMPGTYDDMSMMPGMYGAMPGMYGAYDTTGMMTSYDPYVSAYMAAPPPAYVDPYAYTYTAPITDTAGFTSFYMNFDFSPDYTNLTPLTTLDDGIEEFAPVGTIVGKVSLGATSGTVTYQMTVTDGNDLDPSLQIVSDITAAGAYSTTALNLNTLFSIDANGVVRVNDPLALSHFVNQSGFNLTITATDGAGLTQTISRHIRIQDLLPGINPLVGQDVNLSGTSGADFLVSTGTANTTLDGGNGGSDVLIGNAGNNIIRIANGGFKLISGGDGDDTIVVGNNASARIVLGSGTAGSAGDVIEIETIDLGTSSAALGNQLNMRLKDVFEMTDQRHTLEIVATAGVTGSVINVITGGANEFSLASGTFGSGLLVYTGTFDGQAVTLKINQGSGPGTVNGIAVTTTAASAGINFVPAPEYNSTTPLFPTPGINEFAAAGTTVGFVHASGAAYYMVTVNGANNPQRIVPDSTVDTSGAYSLSAASLSSTFAVDPVTGRISVQDPLALSHFLNPGGFYLTITAFDGDGVAIGTINPLLQIRDFNGSITADIPPQVAGPGDVTLSGVNGTGADFLVGDMISAANLMLSGGGGTDIILGGGGNDIIHVADGSFKLVDGGFGLDTLKLSNLSGGVTLDFTTLSTGTVRNVEKIDLGLSGGVNGSDITLNIQDVFEMTGPSHMLTIQADASALNSTVSVTGFAMMNGSATPLGNVGTLSGAIANTLTYTGVYSGVNVTLIINQNNGVTGTTGDIAVTNV